MKRGNPQNVDFRVFALSSITVIGSGKTPSKKPSLPTNRLMSIIIGRNES